MSVNFVLFNFEQNYFLSTFPTNNCQTNYAWFKHSFGYHTFMLKFQLTTLSHNKLSKQKLALNCYEFGKSLNKPTTVNNLTGTLLAAPLKRFSWSSAAPCRVRLLTNSTINCQSAWHVNSQGTLALDDIDLKACVKLGALRDITSNHNSTKLITYYMGLIVVTTTLYTNTSRIGESPLTLTFTKI